MKREDQIPISTLLNNYEAFDNRLLLLSFPLLRAPPADNEYTTVASTTFKVSGFSLQFGWIFLCMVSVCHN
jgi:hypothetical protein